MKVSRDATSPKPPGSISADRRAAPSPAPERSPQMVDTAAQVEVGGLRFAYDDRVLTPRPWTEAQASWARELSAVLPDGPVLELCSGVGHIGLLSLLGNDRSLVMVDASQVACAYAEGNAATAGLAHRVTIRRDRLESAVGPDERFPLVLADPPWVPSAQVGRFPQDPLSAIDGGHDGLAVTLACLEVIARHLHDHGVAILQVGTPAQAVAVGAWLRGRPPLRLECDELREFGERGVLVTLRRPDGLGPC